MANNDKQSIGNLLSSILPVKAAGRQIKKGAKQLASAPPFNIFGTGPGSLTRLLAAGQDVLQAEASLEGLKTGLQQGQRTLEQGLHKPAVAMREGKPVSPEQGQSIMAQEQIEAQKGRLAGIRKANMQQAENEALAEAKVKEFQDMNRGFANIFQRPSVIDPDTGKVTTGVGMGPQENLNYMGRFLQNLALIPQAGQNILSGQQGLQKLRGDEPVGDAAILKALIDLNTLDATQQTARLQFQQWGKPELAQSIVPLAQQPGGAAIQKILLGKGSPELKKLVKKSGLIAKNIGNVGENEYSTLESLLAEFDSLNEGL